MTNLVVQTTQHISQGKRVVVLHKLIHNPQFGQGLFVVAFQKKPRLSVNTDGSSSSTPGSVVCVTFIPESIASTAIFSEKLFTKQLPQIGAVSVVGHGSRD